MLRRYSTTIAAAGTLWLLVYAVNVQALRNYEVTASTNQFKTASKKHPAKIRVSSTKLRDIVDITSDYVQGSGAILRLKVGKWPLKMLVRLHTSDGSAYAMLDHFSIGTDVYKVNSKYGKQKIFPLLQLDRQSQRWSVVGETAVRIEYKQDYMQITVPRKILKSNPEFIKFSWIYMYSIQ